MYTRNVANERGCFFCGLGIERTLVDPNLEVDIMQCRDCGIYEIPLKIIKSLQQDDELREELRLYLQNRDDSRNENSVKIADLIKQLRPNWTV